MTHSPCLSGYMLSGQLPFRAATLQGSYPTKPLTLTLTGYMMICKPQTSLFLSVRYGTGGGGETNLPRSQIAGPESETNKTPTTQTCVAKGQKQQNCTCVHAQSEKRLPTHGTTKTASADTSDLDNSVQQAQPPPETRGRQTATNSARVPAQAQSYVTKTLSSGHKPKAQAP